MPRNIDSGFVQLGWFDLTAEDALDFDLPQAVRTNYEVFVVGFWGFGITLCVRVKP